MKKRGVFDPNLAIEAFPGVPQNTVLTMGSRPSKRCRTHTETNDFCHLRSDDHEVQSLPCIPIKSSGLSILELCCKSAAVALADTGQFNRRIREIRHGKPSRPRSQGAHGNPREPGKQEGQETKGAQKAKQGKQAKKARKRLRKPQGPGCPGRLRKPGKPRS